MTGRDSAAAGQEGGSNDNRAHVLSSSAIEAVIQPRSKNLPKAKCHLFAKKGEVPSFPSVGGHFSMIVPRITKPFPEIHIKKIVENHYPK